MGQQWNVGAVVLAAICLGSAACIQVTTGARRGDLDASRRVKSLVEAETLFHSQHHRYGGLEDLGPSGAALIPADLATGKVGGFQFAVEANGESYRIRASPVTKGVTGYRSFYVDQSQVIRESYGDAPADSSSPETFPPGAGAASPAR